MANIADLNQEQVDKSVKNTHLLYGGIINLIKEGKVVPTIQAKHQRVYIRPAVVGEKIYVEADKAEYTAVEGQYVVYNDSKNRYLVNEKAYKRYEQDENLETKIDADQLEVKGFKPKGLPQLVVKVDDLKNIIDINDFTYFPSNWWGSTNTIAEGFVIILPFDSTKSLKENVASFEQLYETFPKVGTPKEEVTAYLSSGKGLDCYAIDKDHVDTYAICDKKGTFKDPVLKAKAHQTEAYLGQNLEMGKNFE